MKTLFSLPVEVLEDYVFEKLSWNDLLRLRHVSQEFRTRVNDYIRQHPEKVPEITVRYTSMNAYPDSQSFLELDIPTTKLYLRNNDLQGANFRNRSRRRSGWMELLPNCGSTVKHLHLEYFSLYTYPNREPGWGFLEGLENLESLTVDHFVIGRPATRNQGPALPASFGNLKSLTLNTKQVSLEEFAEDQAGILQGNLHNPTIWLTQCRYLENLRVSSESQNSQMFWTFTGEQNGFLGALITALKEREGSWKSVAFDVHPESIVSRPDIRRIYHVIDRCAQAGIPLKGLHSHWMDHEIWGIPPMQPLPLHRILDDERDTISTSMTEVTCTRYPPFFWSVLFGNLKILEIRSAREFMVAFYRELEQGLWHRISWIKSLTTLRLTWDFRWNQEAMMKSVFPVICMSDPLETLREVELRFPEQKKAVGQKAMEEALEQVGSYAPNLRKFTLVNWRGSQGALALFWPGVVGLEELKLENCGPLDYAAVVGGEDATNPVFLKLTNLRKLSLERVSTFQDIGGLSKVLGRIRLTHLRISVKKSSSNRVKEVYDWFDALREGPFSESVEDITWNGCRLHEVESDEELRQIGLSFRSCQML